MNKIKQRREEMGLSQAELGKMIGCSQQHILRIENGYEVGADKAIRLSEVLKIPLEEIISDKWKNVFDKMTNQKPITENNFAIYEHVYKVVKIVEDFINDHNVRINSEKKLSLLPDLLKNL